MTSRSSLPEFEKPPIIEALLGVEFAPLKGWAIPHHGLFWQRIRSDYPKQTVHAPIATTSELKKGPGPVLELVQGPPSVRCWYIDEPETRLLQVQDTHFLHNWRKVSGIEPYPRYFDSIRPVFEAEWKRFLGFLEDERIEGPDVLRCEITYINHFEKGQEWSDHSDLGQILSDWRLKVDHDFLPPHQLGRLQLAYPIANNKGTLFARLEPGIRNRDAKEILQLTLTAKGKPESSETDHIMAWYDVAHEWIVRGFTDITTTEMHSRWGRRK